jgi:hypothetical protein
LGNDGLIIAMRRQILRIFADAAQTGPIRSGLSIQEPETKKALDSLRIPGTKSFIVFSSANPNNPTKTSP